ncbi:MAG: 16S rRNA (adenine(1518)-N(6)/adenine(1519)-N(6))-dimethyltransferase RsmA [Candidatus Hodarchaeota archaeon]
MASQNKSMMKSLLKTTVSLLKKFDIRPNKRKGQTFIIDVGIIDRQISYADVCPKDVVLEIGSGLGALTCALAEKAKEVITIEIDRRFVDVLDVVLSNYDNVKVIFGDALKLDLPKVDKIISNIPYNISSDLTFKILKMHFEKAILMYQLEFAKRMIAAPGSKDYGRLTIGVYYRAHANILEEVSRTSFFPTPDVDSAMVELLPKEPPFKVQDEEKFFEVVRGIFIHAKKKLNAALNHYLKHVGIKKEKARKIIAEIPYRDMRVRSLEPEKISIVSNLLYKELRNLKANQG